MIIRQATLLDLLPLAPLALDYSKEAQGHHKFKIDMETCMTNAALTIVDDDGCFLVVYVDKEPVGFLWGTARALPWCKEKIAFDTILYVIPAKRKTSVAYKLMKAWEQWAKLRNTVSVQISIASGIHEDDSIKFFNKMGYSYIGQQFRKEIDYGVKP